MSVVLSEGAPRRAKLTEADLDAHIAGRYGCPTTRRYSRTLAEAFPDLRAAAVELPPRRRWALSASDPADRMVMRACFVAAVALVAMALGGWL